MAPAANAQYFGRNKVEYETFKFRVLKTEHFDVYYYPEEQAAVEQAAHMAERWYARLSKILDHELRGRQPLILYASQADFQQTTAIPGDIGEGTGGVTQVIKRRIVLPLAGSLVETDHVIGHELVHAFQFDITGESGTGAVFEAPTASQLPLWFIEGMAEYLSLGAVDANTAMWMRDAAINGKFPSINDLNNPRYFPYRYGQALWAYIGGRYGDDQVGQALKVAGEMRDAVRALEKVTGASADSLSADWKSATLAEYKPLVDETRPAGDYGPALIAHHGRLDVYNLAPSLSPDGKQFVFLSERGLFSMDMYLADAATGHVEKKIVSTALNEHFESLEFINSAGAWDMDGRRFAFAAVSQGRPVLDVLDVPTRKIEREIMIPAGVEQIYTPTWSPDGSRIAFSATVGGWLDLYVADVASGKLQRLTNDAYAEMQPAWSPDGKTIAYVTDRFGTDLADLSYGGLRLALLDLESGTSAPLATFPDGKSINPQWSPDGTAIYFISDQNGISNVYRIELGSGQIHQITDLLTGVSGITDLSPAMSVASESGRLAYSVYERDGFDIFSIDADTALAGEPVAQPLAAVRPNALPPADRGRGEVLVALHNSTAGLPADSTFSLHKYHPKLGLDYVGQTYVGVGAGPTGTFVAGGSALYFSDMLGRRSLITQLQVYGGFQDIAALVAYQNVRTRWNWAVLASQIPYRLAGFSQSLATSNGQTVVVDQTFNSREIDRQVGGLVQYPFSRAQRIEFSGTYTNISFSNDIETDIFALSGQRLEHTKQSLPSPSALNLGQVSTALVYDNALFGGTSPVLGQRYRLEVSPIAGSLNFVNTLADYRRYFMPVRPITLAGRILQYGRWGGDAQDERLTPLFIGYQQLVRGYDNGSFNIGECVPSAESACPAFDQLFGSRIWVGNFELRVPLLGPLGVIRSPGLPSLDMAGFFDAGAAWWSSPGLIAYRGIDRLNTDPWNPVTSYGAALRLNLFGFAVLETDVVHPNDRPNKGWYLEFGLTPGF